MADELTVHCAACGHPATLNLPADAALERVVDDSAARGRVLAVGVTWRCNCHAGVDNAGTKRAPKSDPDGCDCGETNWHEVRVEELAEPGPPPTPVWDPVAETWRLPEAT